MIPMGPMASSASSPASSSAAAAAATPYPYNLVRNGVDYSFAPMSNPRCSTIYPIEVNESNPHNKQALTSPYNGPEGAAPQYPPPAAATAAPAEPFLQPPLHDSAMNRPIPVKPGKAADKHPAHLQPRTESSQHASRHVSQPAFPAMFEGGQFNFPAATAPVSSAFPSYTTYPQPGAVYPGHPPPISAASPSATNYPQEGPDPTRSNVAEETPQVPPSKRDIPLSSILNQVSQLDNSDQPPALEHIERKAPGGKPRSEMPNLPAMPMLKPAPSFIPAPGDNVPLAIPDVNVPPPAPVLLQPPPINKLWSEATEDDIENHALTIEVEKPSSEEGAETEIKDEGLALFKEDLSALVPVPMGPVDDKPCSPKQPLNDVVPKQPQITSDEPTITSSHVKDYSSVAMEEAPKEHHVTKEHKIPEMPPLTTAHIPGIPLTSAPELPVLSLPRTPSELSRDNELLQFAKLVDKLHSEGSSMEAEPPSINLDIPDSFATFVDGRRMEGRAEDHSAIMHGLSPDLSNKVIDTAAPEKVCTHVLIIVEVRILSCLLNKSNS